jgi:hypothetical protein
MRPHWSPQALANDSWSLKMWPNKHRRQVTFTVGSQPSVVLPPNVNLATVRALCSSGIVWKRGEASRVGLDAGGERATAGGAPDQQHAHLHPSKGCQRRVGSY